MDKRLALTLFCYCRQAERSVDFALSSAVQWRRLCDYYDAQKREGLAWMLENLRSLNADCHKAPHRTAFAIPVFAVFIAIWRLLTNPLRSWWAFPASELGFIYTTLATFADALNYQNPPELSARINLRMDFNLCESFIQGRMLGLPEFQKASTIEHFCQAAHVKSVTMDEMGLLPPMLKS
jgi:hypothetical protein